MCATFNSTLTDALREVPLMDVHTHLIGGNLGAKGLHDILLYHMAVSDLYSAGCPSGARLTQYPGWPTIDEAHSRIKEALPYLKHVRNTSISWGIRIILEDLFDWHDPVTESNWQKLDEKIRSTSQDITRQRQIIQKAKIQRFGSEIARREQGQDDDVLQYALEWGFFTRSQWGEFDTALYEAEKCWGNEPGPPSPIGGSRPAPDKTIRSLEDVHEAIHWYVSRIPYDTCLSMATHISTDIDFQPISDEQMKQALQRRPQAGPAERDIYASYINEVFLTELEQHASDIVYQFSFAAEPLPFETASRLSQKTIGQVADMISRHPNLKFQSFLSSRHANQSMCTLARELPNFSLVGYWWHNFFPGTIRQVIEERLDMVATNKQIGFFSDAYCVEWAYAKAKLVKICMADVLAQKIESGQYTEQLALDIAREILFETPQSLLGMKPAAPGVLTAAG